MSPTPSPPLPPSTPDPPASLAPKLELPLRATDFEAGLAGMLHQALNGTERGEVLAGLCRHLSKLLNARLVLLSRRQDNGSMATEAASVESALWLELQRIPQRWDDGLSSYGPAGAALRAQSAVRMEVSNDGFALWHASAGAEHVRQIVALPIRAGGCICVLELYLDGELARGASTGTLTVARLTQALEVFLADLRQLELQHLLSRALECAGNSAFITDLDGTIVWSNSAFTALSGYTADEVRGRNPSLLRSGEQGVRYYRELWGTIRAGNIWHGETVDRAKDGGTYTIHQTVSPVSQDGRITHYLSVHEDIGRDKRARTQLELATRMDPATGLLTPAAFEQDLRKVLADEPAAELALVLVSLRGLQRAASALGEELEHLVALALGKRVRELTFPPNLAGALGRFEYVLALRGDVSDAAIDGRLRTLAEKLAEPLPYLGEMPELGLHSGTARFPSDGATFRQLRLKADRQLADEPHRPARREVRH